MGGGVSYGHDHSVEILAYNTKKEGEMMRHLPYRTLEQAKAKVRHGKLTLEAAGLPENYGSHWREWGALSDADLEIWWRGWTDPANNPVEDPL